MNFMIITSSGLYYNRLMSSLYFKNNLALIDFTARFCTNYEELTSSEEFKEFLLLFLEHLEKRNPKLYLWLKGDKDRKRCLEDLLKTVKLLCILDVNEVEVRDKGLLLEVVEEAYHFWRNKERFSLVHSDSRQGVLNNFMVYDSNFNHLIINFYRLIQEKLQGYKNNVYRQLQAGSNGSLLLYDRSFKLEGEYSVLNKVPFITKFMMRSPLIIHLKHNKRIGMFTERYDNPILEKNDYSKFFCFPILVGDSLTFVYFDREYTSSAIGLANLFEFYDITSSKRKPDCIILFGVDDHKGETSFYKDVKNNVYVGKLSKEPIIEYFGYFKKMALTLHNLRKMDEGKLPIHGAMLNIYFKDGRKKGIVLMGDSGAGKSETIDAMSKMSDEIAFQEVIFDDMGTMYVNDRGEVVCKGTETGAFTRLDDLDVSSAYKDMDRSIFFNPETSNARVIMPVSTYNLISSEHKVDVFLYANNYDENEGIELLSDSEKAKEIYKRGRRYAIGTTSEKNFTETYFANPFGPMQRQKQCDPIIDEVFKGLSESNVKTGEIFTHLSLKDKEEGLKKASESLIGIL